VAAVFDLLTLASEEAAAGAGTVGPVPKFTYTMDDASAVAAALVCDVAAAAGTSASTVMVSAMRLRVAAASPASAASSSASPSTPAAGSGASASPTPLPAFTIATRVFAAGQGVNNATDAGCAALAAARVAAASSAASAPTASLAVTGSRRTDARRLLHWGGGAGPQRQLQAGPGVVGAGMSATVLLLVSNSTPQAGVLAARIQATGSRGGLALQATAGTWAQLHGNLLLPQGVNNASGCPFVSAATGRAVACISAGSIAAPGALAAAPGFAMVRNVSFDNSTATGAPPPAAPASPPFNATIIIAVVAGLGGLAVVLIATIFLVRATRRSWVGSC